MMYKKKEVPTQSIGTRIKILLNPIFHHSIIRNTLALLKNRHMERTGHPIGDRLKLEPN
ncbi:MAG: hypothetical protein JRI41_07160 [Deltaproteobacteria bacterium]|nr:hypothetical protein [Deltaproteobacteria bacterium]